MTFHKEVVFFLLRVNACVSVCEHNRVHRKSQVESESSRKAKDEKAQSGPHYGGEKSHIKK